MTLEELNVFVTTQANVGMEAYYWWCTGLMIIIHVGFLMYEVGATRMQNAVSSGVKNLLAFAFMIPTFWLFGWWIYLAFPGGFVPIGPARSGISVPGDATDVGVVDLNGDGLSDVVIATNGGPVRAFLREPDIHKD